MIIAALSTPHGRGAINVIRLSGEGCKKLAAKMFSPFPDKANYLKAGTVSTKYFDDKAMCVFFDAPRSFTGEESVEFHCHGGETTASAVLERCFELGARPALNGEFSKRAFINGKQNLSNAEGVIDLIDAESKGAARAAAMLAQNELGKKIEELLDTLCDTEASIEAALDYPEEELEGATVAEQTIEISRAKRTIDALVKTVRLGGLVKNGAYVAIVGATNVGKSSLLNALAGEERAIVSDSHGTTRDTVEISLVYKDLKITFADTAGFRQTSDATESQGIERSKRAAKRASVVLYIREGAADKELSARENQMLGTDCPVLNVYSKNDIYRYDRASLGNDDVAVSSFTGENIERLKEKIYSLLIKDADNGLIITNLRHADCLRRASEALANALDALSSGITLDCVAQDVRAARTALGEITGDTADEEIIDRIFSRFCLGK